jgi:hypothetical protein
MNNDPQANRTPAGQRNQVSREIEIFFRHHYQICISSQWRECAPDPLLREYAAINRSQIPDFEDGEIKIAPLIDKTQ